MLCDRCDREILYITEREQFALHYVFCMDCMREYRNVMHTFVHKNKKKSDTIPEMHYDTGSIFYPNLCKHGVESKVFRTKDEKEVTCKSCLKILKIRKEE